MELQKILPVFVSVILISQTEAFLPSHAGRSLASTDYTLTDLTIAGIVRVVARYFEDSNPDRYKPGDLTNLDPLTPSRLFQVHYGDCVYSTKFERAISAILEENLRISKDYAKKAMWHFNGNQINKGNRKMIKIRDTLLANLNVGDETAPDYDVARLYCGQILHMAQSFYSNTNWIELNRWLNSLSGVDEDTITTSTDLGIMSPFTWRQSPGSVDMCKNCDTSVSPPDCSDNLLHYVYYITSGYKSGQDKAKPAADPESTWGKCSHGGKGDDSQGTVAIGGINKETSNPSDSPHYTLHGQAALTALQATEDFFYHADTGLYKLIGEKKFRKLLNLDAGTSLSFVIDTTQSMVDEIEAVKLQIIDIVSAHDGTCLAPSKYVIAPFNDPSVGPVLVTSDATTCINFINNLDVVGGGDCPEMANGGMELGLSHSLDGTIVYMYTDADDKDKEKLPDVLALIEKKKIQMKFLLTGECRAGTSRRKRAAERVSSSYETIASVSGGEIYRTDNDGIEDLSRIVEGDIRASKVTISKKSVTVPDEDNFSVEIPVDSTAQEVLVSIVGELTATTVSIVNPKGERASLSDGLGVDVFTQSDNQVVFSINTTQEDTKGEWVVEVQNIVRNSLYRVKVSANSLVDFSFDLLELDESGSLYPIDGLPVQGDSLKMMVQIKAPEYVRSVSGVYLMDTTGKETLFTADVEPITGRTAGQYLAGISVPQQAFVAVIRGVDINGMTFVRTQPSEVQVVLVNVEHVIGTSTVDTIYPGGNASFHFQLTNSGPDDSMTISVTVSSEGTSTAILAVDSAVQATVEPTSAVLATGASREGVVTVAAADDVTIGTTVKVTLTVHSSLTSVLNFLSVDVTVFEFQNDTALQDNPDLDDFIDPTCTVLTVSKDCTLEQMGSNCQDHEWWVQFQATDDRIVTETVLEPGIGRDQTLDFEKFGLKDNTARYTSTCCCPSVNITVRDGNGNTALCGVDYYTPVAGKIKEPVCNGPIPFDDPGLSVGVIVVIAVGAVAAVILSVAFIYFLVKSCSGGSRARTKGMVTPVDCPSTPEVRVRNFKHPMTGAI